MPSLESTLKLLLTALESRLRIIVEDSVEKAVAQAVTNVLDERESCLEWLTNSQAMALLDKGRSTLARYRADGTLPYSKLGGDIYYRRVDIEALLERGRVEENSTQTT